MRSPTPILCPKAGTEAEISMLLREMVSEADYGDTTKADGARRQWIAVKYPWIGLYRA